MLLANLSEYEGTEEGALCFVIIQGTWNLQTLELRLGYVSWITLQHIIGFYVVAVWRIVFIA